MSKKKSYNKPLSFRPKPTGKEFLIRSAIVLVLSLAIFWGFLSMIAGGSVTSPKTAILQHKNDAWAVRMEVMNRTLDIQKEELRDLYLRNEDIYRCIFGMGEIPEDAVGKPSDGRYSVLDGLQDGLLRSTYIRQDVLLKDLFMQVKSFDEVTLLSRRAGDMASCIPAIIPIDPAKGTYRISSSYGRRIDPVYGNYRFHHGVDFATKKGTPVYATGDGVIKDVKFEFRGYGNQVVIDHGFGYCTRYAHLSAVYVGEGMKIKRGECIGTVGNSGKSTGDHLHYEVEYRGKDVNPYNFYDLDVSPQEYAGMVTRLSAESQAMLKEKFTFSPKRR